jgi:DNA gyrase subunit B
VVALEARWLRPSPVGWARPHAPIADRIGDGLTAVVSVKLDRPEFEGATHGILGNTEVSDCVAQAVRDHLSTWHAEDPRLAAAVISRITQDTAHD